MAGNVRQVKVGCGGRPVRLFCHAANLLTLGFGLLLVTLDPEPQVIFGRVLIVLMTATAFAFEGARNNSGG